MLRVVLVSAAALALLATGADGAPRHRHAHAAPKSRVVAPPSDDSFLTGGTQANVGEYNGYAIDTAFPNLGAGDGPAFLNNGTADMMPSRYGVPSRGFPLIGF